MQREANKRCGDCSAAACSGQVMSLMYASRIRFHYYWPSPNLYNVLFLLVFRNVEETQFLHFLRRVWAERIVDPVKIYDGNKSIPEKLRPADPSNWKIQLSLKVSTEVTWLTCRKMPQINNIHWGADSFVASAITIHYCHWWRFDMRLSATTALRYSKIVRHAGKTLDSHINRMSCHSNHGKDAKGCWRFKSPNQELFVPRCLLKNQLHVLDNLQTSSSLPFFPRSAPIYRT